MIFPLRKQKRISKTKSKWGGNSHFYKKVKEIRIIPKANARFFEIQYIYEAECVQRNLGALNILRKSNVVSLEGLYTRGEVDTPIRIRIA